MFGPLGIWEILLILGIALLIFGPKKLPEIGRTLGKSLGEFRRATTDLKRSIEREIDQEEWSSKSGAKSTPAQLSEATVAASGGSASAVVPGGLAGATALGTEAGKDEPPVEAVAPDPVSPRSKVTESDVSQSEVSQSEVSGSEVSESAGAQPGGAGSDTSESAASESEDSGSGIEAPEAAAEADPAS